MLPAYITHPDCARHEMGADHPECPERLDAINDQLLASGLDVALSFREAPQARAEQITRAHTTHYATEITDLLRQVQHARQQLIQRTLEARGLDASPPLRAKLAQRSLALPERGGNPP